MEIALLLGLTGERAPQPLRDWLPALTPTAIAMLGHGIICPQAANVRRSPAASGYVRPTRCRRTPLATARLAVEHVAAHRSRLVAA